MKKLILSKENKQTNNSIIENNKFIKSFSNCKLEMKNTLTNNDFITLNKDNKIIKMNYVNKARNIIKGIQEDNKIIYPSIEDGVDLKYEVLDNKLKESIVINELQDNYQYDFELDIGDLVPSFNKENNTLELKENNKTIYRLLSPYMVDNKKDYSSDCAYEIEQNENILNIKLTCSSEWINSPNRTLPIIIDPTIEVVQNEDFKITGLSNKLAYVSPNKTERLGKFKSNNGSIFWEGLSISINCDNIRDNLEKDSKTILSATIILPVQSNEFHKILDGKYVFYTNSKVIKEISTNVDKQITLDVTDIVLNKTGIQEINLRHSDDPYLLINNSKYNNATTVLNAVNQDYLIISNLNEDGEQLATLSFEYKENDEDNDKKLEFDNGQAGTTELNLLNGSISHEFFDTTIEQNTLSINLNHIFDSNNTENIGLGKGWKTNLHQTLTKEKDINNLFGYKKITYNDGNKKYYFRDYFTYIDFNNVKRYLKREDVYLDFDQKLKYKENDDRIYEVKYECKSDDGLVYVSGSNLTEYLTQGNFKFETYYIISYKEEKVVCSKYNNNQISNGYGHYFISGNQKTYVAFKDIIKEGYTLKYVFKSTGNKIDVNIDYEAPLQLCVDEQGYYLQNIDKNKTKERLSLDFSFDTEQSFKEIYYNDDVKTIDNQILNLKSSLKSMYLSAYGLCISYISLNKQFNYNYNEKILLLIREYNERFATYYSENGWGYQALVKSIEKPLSNYFSYNDVISQLTLNSNTNFNTVLNSSDNYQKILSIINNLMQHINNKIQNAKDSSKYENGFEYEMQKNQVESCAKQLEVTYNLINEQEKQIYLLEKQKDALIEQQRRNVNDFIIDQNGNTLGFDGYGRLILIEDKFENKINIEFGYESENKDKLISIYTDNQTIKFNYDKQTNLLSSLIDKKGRKIKYYYNNQNQLIKIQHYSSKTTLLDYNSLFKITNSLLQTLDIRKKENDFLIDRYVVNKEIDNQTTLSSNDDLIKVESYKLSTLNNSTTITNLLNNKVDTYIFENNKTTQENDKTTTICEFNGKLLLSKKVYFKTFVENKATSSNLINDYFYISLNDFKAIKYYKKFLLFIKRNKPLQNNIADPTALLLIGCKDIETGRIRSFDSITYSKTDDLQIFKTIEIKNIDEISDVTLKFETSEKNTITDIYLIPFEQTKYVYNNENKLIKEQSDDETIDYEYDENNLCIKKEEINIYGDKLITTYSYNSSKQITLSEDSKNNIIEYYYDEKGNCVEQRSYNKNDASLMKVNKTQYDEKGNIINYGSIKNKDGNYPTQIIKYNDLNTETKGFKNEIISHNYDFNTDELISISSSANGISNSTSFSYNYGLLTSMKHLGCEVRYAYDGSGRKIKTVFNGNEILQTTYKDNYNSVKEGDHYFDAEIKNGIYIENVTGDGYYEYCCKDNDNNVFYKTYSADDSYGKIKYKYLGDNLSEIIYFDTYRQNGYVYYEKIKNEYKNGLIIKQNKIVDDQISLLIENNYDINYKFIDSYSLTLESETRLGYQNTYMDDLLVKITLNNTNVDNGDIINEILKSEYKYDALNRVQHQKITSNKVNMCHEYSYLQQDNNSLDLIGEDVLKIEIYGQNKTAYLSETHTYEYDVNGNITSISDDETINRYEYDELNRLIREDNRLLNKTIIYKYDRAGNILLKKNYSYNLNNILPSTRPRIINEYIYDCDNRDRLISYDGKLIHYDKMGRPRVYKNNKLQWNNKGQLLLYENENLDKFEYKYDSNGIRNKKIINGKETTYITNGTQILQMKNDNGKFIFHYILNKLVGFEYTNTSGTKEYLYIRNIQGDITSIIDTEGNIICTYAYDGYGNHIVLDENGKEDTSLTSIGHLNPFRYRGYYFDEESGLYYLNSRYYDPETGRFISPDILTILDETKGQINGLNLYMYCRDNPIMYTDDSGCLPNWAKWLIGGVVIVGLTIATIATGGVAGGVAGFILAGALKGAVIGAVSGALVNGTISGISSAVNGEGFWLGFFDGAAHGFMSGAVIGGITGAISSGFQVVKAASYWDKGTLSSGYKSMKYHYTEEVVNKGLTKGNSIVKYTNDALRFANNNGMNFTLNLSRNKLQSAWTLSRYFGSGTNGLYTSSGKIITFHYFYTW